MLRLTGILILAIPLAAQISPGPLSKAHEALGGPLRCAQCHAFGAGTPKLRCLNCHEEIRRGVAARAGYHGRQVKAARGDNDCARCHTEHYGPKFSIVKWPESRDDFDHRLTGYPLEGAHARLECKACHNPKKIQPAWRAHVRIRDLNRTYLGLTRDCLGCHTDEHRGQLASNCSACHDFARWKPARGFDHARTRFPLTGKHQAAECARCHRAVEAGARTVRYTGIAFQQCTGCHEDVHRKAFQAGCQACHDTQSWKQPRTAPAFDHARTRFPLEGKHHGLACFKCHQDANFKNPVAHARCLDCHKDEHGGQFTARKDAGDCAGCHTVESFQATTFTAALHRGTRFPLEGKHAAVECARCHVPAGKAARYHPPFEACLDCHRDVHAGQFAAPPHRNRCEACHTVDGFSPSTFTLARHRQARFDLAGAHAAVPCAECHKAPAAGTPVPYRFPGVSCRTCHHNPHGDFLKTAPPAAACESCHRLKVWSEVREFDHAATGYALEGAHRTLACAECHRVRGPSKQPLPVRFAHTPGRCAECHEDIHAGQFDRGAPADCSACHTPVRWAAARFDHSAMTPFRLDGAHQRVPCGLCHNQRREINGRSVVMYRNTPRLCAECHR